MTPFELERESELNAQNEHNAQVAQNRELESPRFVDPNSSVPAAQLPYNGVERRKVASVSPTGNERRLNRNGFNQNGFNQNNNGLNQNNPNNLTNRPGFVQSGPVPGAQPQAGFGPNISNSTGGDAPTGAHRFSGDPNAVALRPAGERRKVNIGAPDRRNRPAGESESMRELQHTNVNRRKTAGVSPTGKERRGQKVA